ncbi:MAG: hypothetical protein PF795_03295 [Kiritimatiellae bacterium]|nr:hypothetical protein [Kiritimatiellia bacterium]
MSLFKFLCRTCILILVAGCDIKTGDDVEDFDSYYYDPGYGGYALESHTLIGNLEVVDGHSGAPLSRIRIEGWIFHDGRIRDRFEVRTNDLGIARIETTLRDHERPFSRLEIRILEPGYRPLSGSLSIRKTGTILDERHLPVTIYEAGEIFELYPL